MANLDIDSHQGNRHMILVAIQRIKWGHEHGLSALLQPPSIVLSRFHL